MGRRPPASRTKVANSKSRKKRKGRQRSESYTPPQAPRRVQSRAAVEPAPKKMRREREQRPPAPWGSFPLQELSVLVGLVILIAGAIQTSPRLIVVGIALACLGGLELTLREHLAGYRSHTILLAGVVFVLVVGILNYYVGVVLAYCLGVGAIAFGATAFWMRSIFRKASGGLSFKVGGFRG